MSIFKIIHVIADLRKPLDSTRLRIIRDFTNDRNLIKNYIKRLIGTTSDQPYFCPPHGDHPLHYCGESNQASFLFFLNSMIRIAISAKIPRPDASSAAIHTGLSPGLGLTGFTAASGDGEALARGTV